MRIFQEQYERMISNVISKVGIMKTDQLVSYIAAYLDGNDYSEAYRIVTLAARHGAVLLSRNEYAMSKEMYVGLSSSQFWDGLDMSSELQVMIEFDLPRIQRDKIDCLWGVINALPHSENFVLSGTPWLVQYIRKNDDEKGDVLTQITKFNDGGEIALGELIKYLPEYAGYEYNDSIERIAILDNASAAHYVPHCGFTKIYKLNEEDITKPLTLVEQRLGNDVWSDSEKRKSM